jgi:hypothetical protein
MRMATEGDDNQCWTADPPVLRVNLVGYWIITNDKRLTRYFETDRMATVYSSNEETEIDEVRS